VGRTWRLREARGEIPPLKGTRKRDVFKGTRDSDRFSGRGGGDRISGRRGDLIKARGGSRDMVRCGPGRDRVLADAGDLVSHDCERVQR